MLYDATLAPVFLEAHVLALLQVSPFGTIKLQTVPLLYPPALCPSLAAIQQARGCIGTSYSPLNKYDIAYQVLHNSMIQLSRQKPSQNAHPFRPQKL